MPIHRIAIPVLGIVLALLLVAARPQAQRPYQSEFTRFEVDEPLSLGRRLQRAARDGFSCAAVGRPQVPFLPPSVVVLMTRSTDSPKPGPAIEAVFARSGYMEDLEAALNKVAATGYRVCGLTVTRAVSGASPYTTVAVMTKDEGPPPAYRVIRSEERGRGEQWRRLEAAAAEGYLVSHLVSRPQPAAADTSEIVFLAEKTTTTVPVTYELVFAGNAVSLQKDVIRAAGEGHRVQAVWAANRRVSVLMAKPMQGAWPDAREYEVSDRSERFVSATDGEMVGRVRYTGGVMSVHNQKVRPEYTITRGVISAVRPAPLDLLSPHEFRLIDQLDADRKRRYVPMEFTLSPGEGRDLQAEIVLRRPRTP
jgi:hypothetical protein